MRFVTLLTLISLPAFAADARWGLRWRAPESCISAADLSAKVQERLGRPVFALNPDFRIDGVLEAGTAPRWKARLTVVSAAGDVLGTREVVGDDADCRALDARIAFIVATTIDAKVSAPPEPVAKAAPAPEAPRVARLPGAVWVELETDDPEATLYRHVGTSYGTVAGKAALLTTISKECVAPCSTFIEQPKSDFFISGTGVAGSLSFSLLAYPEGVKLKVKTGSSYLRMLGWMLSSLSIVSLAVGIPLSIIAAGRVDPHPGVQNPYGGLQTSLRDVGIGLLIGGAAGLGAGIPMIAFSGTKVEFFPLPAATTPLTNTSEI
ncbi:MAG: hypothetical protein Q8N23_36085 [Archangium sp.]|nr:hypothetical protein [Archangium sp.]MDP3158148.1 hypothetical protein [Archangium sp.]MDP3570445.1 hypothetical protein [Archangium sp.]